MFDTAEQIITIITSALLISPYSKRGMAINNRNATSESYGWYWDERAENFYNRLKHAANKGA